MYIWYADNLSIWISTVCEISRSTMYPPLFRCSLFRSPLYQFFWKNPPSKNGPHFLVQLAGKISKRYPGNFHRITVSENWKFGQNSRNSSDFFVGRIKPSNYPPLSCLLDGQFCFVAKVALVPVHGHTVDHDKVIPLQTQKLNSSVRNLESLLKPRTKFEFENGNLMWDLS